MKAYHQTTEELEEFFNNPEFEMVTGLQMWAELQEEAGRLKDVEMMARKAIYRKAFPVFKTGVSNYPLFNGWILKGTGKINYTVDKEMFPQVSAELGAMGYVIDDYLAVSYKLAEGAYNKIVKDESLNKTVGTSLRLMITSSVGAPTLEIVKPRRAK